MSCEAAVAFWQPLELTIEVSSQKQCSATKAISVTNHQYLGKKNMLMLEPVEQGFDTRAKALWLASCVCLKKSRRVR